MLRINFPNPEFRLRTELGKEQIWDAIRRKWVRLTPEEWVRQNFIQFLIKEKSYSASLISVEKQIFIGERKKRYDIVAYKEGVPWLIVECKEANVPLTEEVLMQILRYNSELIAPFLVITNGREHYGWMLRAGAFVPLSEIPSFSR